MSNIDPVKPAMDSCSDLERPLLDPEDLAGKVRIHCLNMTSSGGSSHIGSCLSTVDILAVLYAQILRVNPRFPKHPLRDRFILSKGHAGAAVYATLAEIGFFDPLRLESHYMDGSVFSGHVSHRGIPGIELSTGSLGHGLGVGAGMAKAIKMRGTIGRVFVLLSDGECDEGAVWEAALFAQHHRLDNLIGIVDMNGIQGLDPVGDVLNLEPFKAKWESFNWSVVEVNGHDHNALKRELSRLPREPTKPTLVVAHTVKGKGVSFMENSVAWHYRTARGDHYDKALDELRGR